MTSSAQGSKAEGGQNWREFRRQRRLGKAQAKIAAWHTAVERMTENLDSLNKQLSSSGSDTGRGGSGRLAAVRQFRHETRRKRVTGEIDGMRTRLQELGHELHQLDQLLSRASESDRGEGSMLNEWRDFRRQAWSGHNRARANALRLRLQARQATADALIHLFESLSSRQDRGSAGGQGTGDAEDSDSSEGSSGASSGSGRQADREAIQRAIEELVEEDDPRQPSTQAVNQLLRRQGYTPVSEDQIGLTYREWQRRR